MSLLGLFPDLSPHQVGGLQTSGRLAWDGIGNGNDLLCCGINGGAKWRAALQALGRPRARTVLVWHLHLLRLAPLVSAPGTRVALFLHGIEAWRPREWLTRRLLRRVDLFLSNSRHTWDRFVLQHPYCAAAPHRVVALGLGQPLPHAAPLPADPPAALMLGRLHRDEDYKGHREMIAAWPLVRQRIPEAELWIVGDGDLRPELERLAGAGVRFCGYVSEQHKEELLGRCRCLALPSRAEGFGLVYLEALRLGRPCLVSTLDAGREVVNPPEAGLAADPDRPGELAAAACRLLAGGTEWETWSVRARTRYESGFTARHFQERLAATL
jgi:phosphatidylinositol alpha-1,6-mannosyltransferase